MKQAMILMLAVIPCWDRLFVGFCQSCSTGVDVVSCFVTLQHCRDFKLSKKVVVWCEIMSVIMLLEMI